MLPKNSKSTYCVSSLNKTQNIVLYIMIRFYYTKFLALCQHFGAFLALFFPTLCTLPKPSAAHCKQCTKQHPKRTPDFTAKMPPKIHVNQPFSASFFVPSRPRFHRKSASEFIPKTAVFSAPKPSFFRPKSHSETSLFARFRTRKPPPNSPRKSLFSPSKTPENRTKTPRNPPRKIRKNHKVYKKLTIKFLLSHFPH